jgi:pimeloyl-ACP methyl ester carboxylesterase
MDSDKYISRSGRRLAYAEHGDPNGVPVVFSHGWMASRLTRHPDDGLTASLGVRLITFDRAGIGRSDVDRDKSMLSCAADARALADELELERFHVVGHSGGGPYALACAHSLPDRVAGAAIVCGFAPFDRPDAYAGMTRRMSGYVKLLRAAPWLADPLMRGTPKRYAKDPDKAFAQQFGELCDADRAAFENAAWRQNALASAVEGLAGGHGGMAAESQLLFVRPWGFSVSEIRCHVDLWYGGADTIVAADAGRYLDEAIPDSRLRILPSEGHTLYLTNWAEIMRSLTATAPGASGTPGQPSRA